MNNLERSQLSDEEDIPEHHHQYRQSIYMAQQSSELERVKMMTEYNQEIEEEKAQLPKTMQIENHMNQFDQDKNDKDLVIQQVSSNRQLFITPKLKSIEGWLLKRSPVYIMGWYRQKRYCVITNNKFYYFPTQEKIKHLGCVDFNLVAADVEMSNNRFILKPRNVAKQFIFKPYNPKESIEEWDLQRIIKFDQRYFRLEAILEESDRVSKQQFENLADTGDILLFRGKTLTCSLQRSITRSEYDHVALILRYSSGELILFESTGQVGVGLLKWNRFVEKKWHLLYEKLVFRHLEVDRTDGFIQQLDNFIRFALGKKYKVTPSKLWSSKNKDDNNENSTFFCSELVAAAYKKLGLLPQKLSASKYWPGSFSAEKNLKLQDAHFGGELLIDFNIPNV